MDVRISDEAQEQFDTLPLVIQRRVRAIIARLGEWPAVSGSKPLRGAWAGHHRKRTGDYRLIFRVEEDTVLIEKIAHRGGRLRGSDMTHVQLIRLRGERFVIIPEREYSRLRNRQNAEIDPEMPPLPPADKNGYRPAVEFADSAIARSTIRQRRALGLTQAELAQLAGVRQKTLSRLESGKHSPTVRTVEKIDKALKQAARRKLRRADR